MSKIYLDNFSDRQLTGNCLHGAFKRHQIWTNWDSRNPISFRVLAPDRLMQPRNRAHNHITSQYGHFSTQLFIGRMRPLGDTTVNITGFIQIYNAIANEIWTIKERFQGVPRQCYAAAKFLPSRKVTGDITSDKLIRAAPRRSQRNAAVGAEARGVSNVWLCRGGFLCRRPRLMAALHQMRAPAQWAPSVKFCGMRHMHQRDNLSGICAVVKYDVGRQSERRMLILDFHWYSYRI